MGDNIRIQHEDIFQRHAQDFNVSCLIKTKFTKQSQMIDNQNLDVRTITMAVSLFDCISDSKTETAERVYNKIYRLAKGLVATGDEIAGEYGVPIVNKRVSVTPVSLIGAASGGYLEIAAANVRLPRISE